MIWCLCVQHSVMFAPCAGTRNNTSELARPIDVVFLVLRVYCHRGFYYAYTRDFFFLISERNTIIYHIYPFFIERYENDVDRPTSTLTSSTRPVLLYL